jgi:hypothetical protein
MKKFLLRRNKIPAKVKEQSHPMQGFYHIPNQSSMVLIIAGER